MRERIPGPVTVELVLVIDAAGRVTQVEVIEPRGLGFDEAAIAAARKLVFEPATRDGQPVAARIKYRYVFETPAPTLVGEVRSSLNDQPIAQAQVTVVDSRSRTHETSTSSEGTWSLRALPPGKVHVRVAAKGALPAESDDVLDAGQETKVILRLAPEPSAGPAPAQSVVTVTGKRLPREVSKRTLSRDELQHSAGTQGDALLSVQNLPGIARPPPFSGALVFAARHPTTRSSW